MVRFPQAGDRYAAAGVRPGPDDPKTSGTRAIRSQRSTSARVLRRSHSGSAESGEYPLLSGGDVNIYSLFVERVLSLISPRGLLGLLTPSGIASDLTASDFFKSVSTTGRLGRLYDFENRRPSKPHFFPAVDSRFKFCVLVVSGSHRRFEAAKCAFFLHDVDQVEDEERSFEFTPLDFARVNPNTGTAPVFRGRRDAELTTSIYSRVPVLVDRSCQPIRRVFPVEYVRMFDMTNDLHIFRTEAELIEQGFHRVEPNRWRRGTEEYVPLYVGRSIHQFDHRYASVQVNEANLHNPAFSHHTDPIEHADPSFIPRVHFWVPEFATMWPPHLQWALGFRDIARVTDARTVIAAVVPRSGYGNKLPLLLPSMEKPDAHSNYVQYASLLAANLNSFVLDYIARQKVHSTSLNLYILEQLPVLPEAAYDQEFGGIAARTIVRDEVLRLAYVSHDMMPFAHDMGYEGPPFRWDEEERRYSRARLDALYFLLWLGARRCRLRARYFPHRPRAG